MNSVFEKEKKLNIALTKLKQLSLENPDIKKNIKSLRLQKNQLEIEKQELEEKYLNLAKDFDDISNKLNELHKYEKVEKEKQSNFSEKIDELNQETDILLNEIEEWEK